jgi:hypothetical protein
MHLLVRNQKLVSRYTTSHNLRPSQCCSSVLVSDMSLTCLYCPTEYNFVMFRDSHSIFEVRIQTLGCFTLLLLLDCSFTSTRLDSKQTSILTSTLACTSNTDAIPFVTWTHSQAVCGSSIIDDNCQGFDCCRPSRCLNWLIQTLLFAFTH